MSKKSSGGGSGEVQATKVDSPDVKSGPVADVETKGADPAAGIVYPEVTEGEIPFGEVEGSPVMTVDPASLPKMDPVAADVVKSLGGDRKRFRVTFNPPSPVGDRAKLFECEATDESDALAQWQAYTGFTGETAVRPAVVEIKE